MKLCRSITLYSSSSELQPQIRGWLLASGDGTKMGIVPANYIKVIGKRRGTKIRATAAAQPAAAATWDNNLPPPKTNTETVSTLATGEPARSQNSDMDSLWTEENSNSSK